MKILKITGFLTALLFTVEVWGQNAAAELHFESAEKAFNAGNYKEALAKLDDTEKLTGPMSRTLYLRIVAQDKLFKAGSQQIEDLDFTLLTNLRDNIATYLEVMESYGLDDRYREVYSIGEGLNKYPKTLTEIQDIRERAKLQSEENEAVAEREAYQRFSERKTSINAEQYLRKFPDGVNKDEILTLYEDLVYSEGLKHEKQGELAFARERFITYQKRFSTGKYIVEVEEKLRDLENRIKKRDLEDRMNKETSRKKRKK